MKYCCPESFLPSGWTTLFLKAFLLGIRHGLSSTSSTPRENVDSSESESQSRVCLITGSLVWDLCIWKYRLLSWSVVKSLISRATLSQSRLWTSASTVKRSSWARVKTTESAFFFLSRSWFTNLSQIDLAERPGRYYFWIWDQHLPNHFTPSMMSLSSSFEKLPTALTLIFLSQLYNSSFERNGLTSYWILDQFPPKNL